MAMLFYTQKGKSSFSHFLISSPPPFSVSPAAQGCMQRQEITSQTGCPAGPTGNLTKALVHKAFVV